MNYLASQLIERAKKLADINNTDFLDYDELIQYINDSWTSVYSWLINKGDTQFVKEVQLADGNGTGEYTEYKLPVDFYIMKSIKDKISGRLIERQAESEGINSGKYDIVNDKLRLYGNTSSNIVITYWTVPTFITFPDKEILVDENLNGVLSSAGNSVLFDNGLIYNAKTGESLGSIVINENHTYKLGDGHIFDYTSEGYKYRNYKDQIISEGNGSVSSTFLTDKYYVGYQLMDNGELLPPKIFNKQISDKTDKLLIKYGNYTVYYNGESLDVYYYDDFAYNIKTNLNYSGSFVYPINNFNNHPSFIVDSNNKYYMFILYNEHCDILELDLETMISVCPLRYGLANTNGTDSMITSWMPDTEMNFPNELYFSMIACDLALRFLMKQNADGSSVQALYQDMKQTFVNTLSQSADFCRVKNVY